MNALEIVKAEASSLGTELDTAEAEWILFGHTGFPSFWNVGVDGATPEACLRKQVREFLLKRGKGVA